MITSINFQGGPVNGATREVCGDALSSVNVVFQKNNSMWTAVYGLIEERHQVGYYEYIETKEIHSVDDILPPPELLPTVNNTVEIKKSHLALLNIPLGMLSGFFAGEAFLYHSILCGFAAAIFATAVITVLGIINFKPKTDEDQPTVSWLKRSKPKSGKGFYKY